jgi:two-component system cell cycle sensor histidine kinase PleC
MQTEGLLKQSQQLAVELQTQQKELQQTNEQLAQKAKQLAEQNAEVERKNQEIEQARGALEEKAKELALTSKYKSEFLANMSHELRTPLNAIIGFSELMEQGLFGPLGSPRYEEYANDINGSGKYLLGVINDILDMSKIEAGQFSMDREEIDLCPLIRETVRVISLQAAEKSITVETRIADTMTLFADRRAIKQIAINLLSNAVKFTGQGGHISVRARNTSGALVLTIEDNGCGIPKEALSKLGRPFEQVQNQFSKNHAGSGLGLAISRSLAELQGGALKIRSTEGVGTIVSVRIPVKKAQRVVKAAA